MLRGLLRSLLGTAPAVPAPPPVELDPRAALVQLDAERNRVQQAIVLTLDRRAAALLADDDGQVEALDHEIDQLHRDLERGDLIERRLVARASSIPETFS